MARLSNLATRIGFAVLAFPAACLATPWVWFHRQRIKKSGRSLDGDELIIAQRLGLSHPDTVRIHAVECVPNPIRGLSRMVERIFRKRFIMDMDGITFGSSIYVRKKMDRSLPLIAHELVHVRQYQELGGLYSFLYQYVRQCLSFGYYHAPLEVEARQESIQSIRQANQQIPEGAFGTLSDSAGK